MGWVSKQFWCARSIAAAVSVGVGSSAIATPDVNATAPAIGGLDAHAETTTVASEQAPRK
jgi:hypothetical protein